MSPYGFSILSVFVDFAYNVHDESGVDLFFVGVVIQGLKVSLLIIEECDFEEFQEKSESSNLDISLTVVHLIFRLVLHHLQWLLCERQQIVKFSFAVLHEGYLDVVFGVVDLVFVV